MLPSSTSSFDQKLTKVEIGVENAFFQKLSVILNAKAALELKCSTNNKSCNCIKKFILVGQQWKSIHAGDNTLQIAENNVVQNGFDDNQVKRAQELLRILHFASELKKEKSYDSIEQSDGKSIKELRGMIGLGNGRKRSKRYEEYVLRTREKLRENYFLCEKAAQKLLGYSINFLYKKLRTNPQKTSRIGANSKSDQTLKNSLLTIQQLQDKATSGQDQCCSRSCISTLVNENFNKIVDWRKRLDGCGQKEAQEIVAEVLQAAASLDGSKSFCQNLVHWVTGCSFKKIRRVREHLKKDPASLPEHGLKKYWKDKAQKQSKEQSLVDDQRKQEKPKVYDPGYIPKPYQVHSNAINDVKGSVDNNCNNSNNRSSSQLGVPLSIQSSIPISNFTSLPNMSYQQSTHVTHTNYIIENRSQSVLPTNTVENLPPPVLPTHPMMPSLERNEQIYSKSYVDYSSNQNSLASQSSSTVTQLINLQTVNPNSFVGQSQRVPQYYEMSNANQINYSQPEQGIITALTLGSNDASNVNVENTGDISHPTYFFSANNGSLLQEGTGMTGLTPLFVGKGSQLPESTQIDPNSNWNSPGKPLFLFSPTPVSGQISNKETENWTQVIPFTPLQMVPGSYVVDETKSNWENESGQFFISAGGNYSSAIREDLKSDNVATNQVKTSFNEKNVATYEHGQTFFPTPLTPVAILQPQGNVIPGWLPQPVSSQHKAVTYTNAETSRFFQIHENQSLSTYQSSDKSDAVTTADESYLQISESETAKNDLTSTTHATTDAISEDKAQGVCQGAVISSRDRLVAVQEDSVQPSAVVVNDSKLALCSSQDNKIVSETKKFDSSSVKSFFPFPPPNEQFLAMRVQGKLKKDGDKDDTFINSQNEIRQNESIPVITTGKSHDRSLSSCSSLGCIPEDLLQNSEILKGLSGMTSLPVLSLPSAGWSSDPGSANLPDSSLPQQQSDSRQLNETFSQPAYTSTPSTTVSTLAAGNNSTLQPIINVSGKKKRKISGPDGTYTKAKGHQKQIRFHCFTPSDFADGQVNVSQYKKPCEYAPGTSIASSVLSQVAKKARKFKADSDEIVLDEKNKDKSNPLVTSMNMVSIDHPGQESKSQEIFTPNSEAAPTKESIPIVSASSSTSTMPSHTPPSLKNIPPSIQILVPSSTESTGSSIITPLQFNNPVYLHSGALLTPSGKVNSAFFCRVSPGQLSGSEKISTPHFFNFAPAGFPLFITDSRSKSSKSSESSEGSYSDKPEHVPKKRDHMTLNLSPKSSADDTLQTPSKIPVITPSEVSNFLKDTPDLTPSFNFPMERPSPSDENNPVLDSKKKVAIQSTAILRADKPDGKNLDHLPSIDGSAVANSFPLPSIVVNAPNNSLSLHTKGEVTNPSLEEKESEGSGQLVIALDESHEPVLSQPISIATTEVSLTTSFSSFQLGSSENKYSMKLRPHTLKMATSCPSSGNASSPQLTTPALVHIYSPSQRYASSPLVLFSPQKPGAPFANTSLYSPAFSFVQRPVSGNSSLLKSALTKKQRPVFQFPPAQRANASDSDVPKKTSVDSSLQTQKATSSDNEITKPAEVDSSEPSTSVEGSSKEINEQVMVANDPCLSESAR